MSERTLIAEPEKPSSTIVEKRWKQLSAIAKELLDESHKQDEQTEEIVNETYQRLFSNLLKYSPNQYEPTPNSVIRREIEKYFESCLSEEIPTYVRISVYKNGPRIVRNPDSTKITPSDIIYLIGTYGLVNGKRLSATEIAKQIGGNKPSVSTFRAMERDPFIAKLLKPENDHPPKELETQEPLPHPHVL